jgi:hypothetical protein
MVAGVAMYRYRESVKALLVRKVKGALVREDLVRTSKNQYQLTYYHRGSRYTIELPIRNGPKEITRVTDTEGNDVTASTFPLMGPNQDFHTKIGLPLVVRSLIYHTCHGTTRTFDEVVGAT